MRLSMGKAPPQVGQPNGPSSQEPRTNVFSNIQKPKVNKIFFFTSSPNIFVNTKQIQPPLQPFIPVSKVPPQVNKHSQPPASQEAQPNVFFKKNLYKKDPYSARYFSNEFQQFCKQKIGAAASSAIHTHAEI